MKVCPFCQEGIHAEATKCRYCLSSLTSTPGPEQVTATRTTGRQRMVFSIDRDLIRSAKLAGAIIVILVALGILLYLYGFNFRQAAPGPDQAVYVVDRGLLRFAKFAAAVLAMFVTVGVFLYGFNLKEVAKEIREMAESMQDLHQQATATNYEIQKAKDAIGADRATSAKLLEMTQDAVALTKAEQERINIQVEENRQQLELLVTRGRTSLIEIEQFQSKVMQRAARREPKAPGKKSATHTFTVPELAHIYNFPKHLDGSGQCIAFIELGGGYKDKDLEIYFNRLGIKMPQVAWESVDDAKNKCAGLSGADGQVYLDIEVAGAVAPGARIVAYFAPNTEDGFLHAVLAAVNDKINKPSVLSISWGGPEVNWSADAMDKLNQAFETATASGITVLCAAGDSGVTDGISDGETHVDFPASSPWVLACGGTKLTASAGERQSEVVWSDGATIGTGGGVSNVFPLPDWQSGVEVPARPNGQRGRGLPDVAANASTESGYSIYLHGSYKILGGTAGATPLWAGLIALLNQGLDTKLAHFNPVLYRDIGPAGVLHSVTEGENGVDGHKDFDAQPGWNPSTGWGSPDGTKLLEALRSGHTK